MTDVEALQRENERLRAQIHSLTHKVHAGSTVAPTAMPDDTEIDQFIAEAESFGEAMFEIAEKYDVPLTNNMERWQDGVFIRHVGDFTRDVKAVAERFLVR